MSPRRLVWIVGLLAFQGCQTTPVGSKPRPEGVYELRLFRSSTVAEGTMSLEWTDEGYQGYVLSAGRNLQLVEAEVDDVRLKLQFESYGVRLFLTLEAYEEGLRGSWREVGVGGAAEARRVSALDRGRSQVGTT